jgi:SAM-dependent methyltransferase
MDLSTTNATPDIIGDSLNIPIKTGMVDILLSTQVIEHATRPLDMIQECHRILKPGGFLILTGPLYWPLHEEPHDYHRFTKYGFENLLRQAGFAHWEIKADGGDWAQIFLSINLALTKRWLAPLRLIFPLTGLVMDRFDHQERCPSNYTVLAVA